MHYRSYYTHTGFSLIEALISVALFSIVAVMSVGALTSLIDANNKARSQKVVTNNIYASIEKMTRDIRDGEGILPFSGTQNQITYLWDDDDNAGTAPIQVTYSLSGNTIYRHAGSGPTVAITASGNNGVTVTDLSFTSLDQNLSDQQGGVQVTVKGLTGDGADATEFNIETVISDRLTEYGDRTVTTVLNPGVDSSESGNPESSYTTYTYVNAQDTQDKIPTGTVWTGPSATPSLNVECPWTTGGNLYVVDFEHDKGDRYALADADEGNSCRECGHTGVPEPTRNADTCDKDLASMTNVCKKIKRSNCFGV